MSSTHCRERPAHIVKIRKFQLSLVDKYGYHCLVSELSAYSLPIRNMDLDARPATTEPIRSQRSDQRINQQYPHATALNHKHIDQSRTYPRPGVTSQYFGANSHNSPASQNHIGAYHSAHASQEYIPSSQPGIDASQTQSYGASLPQERFTPLQHSWPPLETRPFSAPETQTQMPMVKNHIESESLAEILPPKRSLPWIKEPDPTSKSKKDEAKPQVEDGPKAKKAKKEAKPRKKATPKKKRTQTGQPTLSGSVRKSGTTARKVAPNIVSKDEQHLPLAGSAPVPALEIPRRESAKPWMDAVMIAQQEDSNITPNTPTPLPLTPAVFTGRGGLRSTPQRHLAKFTSPPVSSAERPQETDQQHLTMTGHANPAIERDQRTDQQPLAEIAGNAQPTSSRPDQISQGVQTTPEIGPEEVLSKVESWVREYRDVPPKQLKDELAKFAAAPEKEQDRIVEDWIIDAVQDENFVKLAKSMESCYKRIVLENAVQATSP